MSRVRSAVVAAATLAAAACAHVAPAPAPELRVLVYNIHAGLDAAGRSNLDSVAALVRATGADIVLLQEVDRRTARSRGVDQIAVLAAATGMHGAFGRTLDYQGGEYGIALLSRWPVLRDSLVHLPVEPPQQRAGGSYEPRGVLHAVVAHPGNELHVFNTHLDASRADHYRLQEIRTVVRVAGGAGTWALLGGDLNAEPGTAVVDYALQSGWRDSFALCGSGDGLTFPYDTPVKRIDYLLLSSGWRCVEARVLESGASDHRPLLVRLTPPSR